MSYWILSINPGSTSTKVAVYEDEQERFTETIPHTDEELARFGCINDQFWFRRDAVLLALERHQIAPKQLSAVVGRGGMLPPVKAGGYLVGQEMVDTILSGNLPDHASNLGALIADAIARPLGIPAYIYDAVSSDEFKPIAKITGLPEVVRQSFCNVLNAKAVARRAAADLGGRYEDFCFLVAHLGGGISISAHEYGKIVDAIPDDAGPFSPERSGSVPLSYVVKMCYSGNYTEKEMRRKLRGMGGLKAYLGTYDMREIEAMVEGGDPVAGALFEAEAYQIGKGIGEMAPVLRGNVDAILLTGGMAYSRRLVRLIEGYVSFLAPVKVYPGENELESLALGALRILRGEEKASVFHACRPTETNLLGQVPVSGA